MDLNMTGYHGGIEIRNFTLSSMSASLNVDASNVILASSNTDGTIVLRGTGDKTDNSAGTTVIDDGFVFAPDIVDAKNNAANAFAVSV